MITGEEKLLWEALRDLNKAFGLLSDKVDSLKVRFELLINRVTDLENTWKDKDPMIDLGVRSSPPESTPLPFTDTWSKEIPPEAKGEPRTFPPKAFQGLHADEKGVTVTPAPGWVWKEVSVPYEPIPTNEVLIDPKQKILRPLLQDQPMTDPKTVTPAPGWKAVAVEVELDELNGKGVITHRITNPEQMAKAESVAKAMKEGVCRCCGKPTTGTTVITDYGNEYAHLECLPEKPKAVERTADNSSKGKY